MADPTHDPALDPVSLLAVRGQDDYIGEPISQLAHALQAAALAAEVNGSDDLIAAALFHDIGHLWVEDAGDFVPGLGVVDHEEVGARYLARAGYPEAVCALVRGHVEAKRYLVATKPAYAASLSEASRATLALQGGPLDADEVRRFERDPLCRQKLRLRGIDERAKTPGLRVPSLESYHALLRRLIRSQLADGGLREWERPAVPPPREPQ